MIETENRRVADSTRENRDEWFADLAGAPGNHDVYAERRGLNAYGASGALRSREANMTDRYDRDGHELRNYHSEASDKRAPASRDDDYYDDYSDTIATRQDAQAYADDEDPEWTYDEKSEQWLDRNGNPYVEAYAEGEEDRYAPAAEGDYLAPRAEARRPQQRKSRGSAVSLAALVLVASIGGGLAYAWKKGGFIGSDLPGIGSAPPVIKANTDPVKIKPAETVAANDQTTHEIFDRSRQPASSADERLVRHEEQPVAVVPVRPAGAATTVAAVPAATPNATRPVTTSEITLPAGDNPAASDQTAAAGMAGDDGPDGPRSVRTIKIMPDNTVVTGVAPITNADPAPAMRSVDVATAAPVSTSPGVAGTTTAATPPDAASQPSPAGASPEPAAASSPVIAPATTEPVTSVPVAPVTSVPATSPPASTTVDDDANATTVAEPAPQAEAAPPAVPPVRPRNIPTTSTQAPHSIPAATTQVASAEPTAASNGSYVVQVSSQRSPADAQAAFQSLQRKYASVLGSMKPSYRKVDLPERGTYYRVRVGSWASSTEAAAFCAKLKAAGGDCVIARN